MLNLTLKLLFSKNIVSLIYMQIASKIGVIIKKVFFKFFSL